MTLHKEEAIGKYFTCAGKLICIQSHFIQASLCVKCLEWHWLIRLYRFQVQNFITHHLYVVLCVHHPRSSLLPSPFILLYPLPPPPPPSPLVIAILLSVSMSCVFFLFFFFFCLISSDNRLTALFSFDARNILLKMASLHWICFALKLLRLFCPLHTLFAKSRTSTQALIWANSILTD